MTLSTTQKNYIATHFGRSNCYASSGVSYTDVIGLPKSGSTQDVVVTLQMGIGSAARGPGGETYMSIPSCGSITDSDILSLGSESYCVGGSSSTPTPPPTGDTSLTWVRDHYDADRNRYINSTESERAFDDGNDGRISSAQADAVVRAWDRHTQLPAYSTTPTPTTGGCTLGSRRCNGRAVEECVRVSGSDNRWDYIHTCEHGCTGAGICTQATSTPATGSQDGTGPFEVTVGGATGTSCESGDPNATLDVSEAYAYYKSEPKAYIGVMGIKVTNHNNDDCYAYFAWEMRMWDGHGYTSCPASTPEIVEISRFLAEVSTTKDITMKKVLANKTDMVGGSFEIPASAEGKKTVCLTLWGNYSYPALVDELAAAGYAQSIPW